MKRRVILASGSKQRKLLMDAINVPYEVIPADIDEKAIRDKDLVVRAEKIARAKAEKVAAKHKGIIIAADTFVFCDGYVFEKPETIERAKEVVRFLSGKKSTVYTGYCYLDEAKQIAVSETTIVEYKIREFTDEEIDAYVQKYPVTTWAGAFSPTHTYGMTMIESINGSFTGFIHGMPMDKIIPLLVRSGLKILP